MTGTTDYSAIGNQMIISNASTAGPSCFTYTKYKAEIVYTKGYKVTGSDMKHSTTTDHLEEVQEIATQRVEEIITSLKEQSNLSEEMKNTDQLYWVGMMNNFKNQAEEIVLKELIYV